MAHDHELLQCSVYLTYYRHDGLETGFSHLKYLRPQHQPRMRLRVLVLDKQRQKHQRPDVAGSRPTNTAMHMRPVVHGVRPTTAARAANMMSYVLYACVHKSTCGQACLATKAPATRVLSVAKIERFGQSTTSTHSTTRRGDLSFQ